jgi:hypothetical protein
VPPETTSAGATPAATDATSVQTTPVSPASGEPTAAPTPAANGDESALGEAGKRAIQVEREAARAAKAEAAEARRELEALKLATASEAEKAIAAAKSEGKAEVLDRLHATIRRSAVREALVAAGVPAGLVADLSKADEFTSLKVGDDDAIDEKDLAEAVKRHKARVPDAYRAPDAQGSADGGARGGDRAPAASMEDAITREYEERARRAARV